MKTDRRPLNRRGNWESGAPDEFSLLALLCTWCPIGKHAGLAQNNPKGHSKVEAQCNVHARRNFVELESSLPEERRRVVESFSVVYRVEA